MTLDPEENGWEFLQGDSDWVDYGGSWFRQHGGCWMVLEVYETNVDYTHELASISAEISLVGIPPLGLGPKWGVVPEALRSWGWKLDSPMEMNIVTDDDIILYDTEDWATHMCAILHSYGAKASIATWYKEVDEDNCDEELDKLIEEAFAEANVLMNKSEGFSALLKKKANRLGATNLDMMHGNPMAPLKKKATGIINGENPKLSLAENIILRVFAASGGKTLGGTPETELALAGLLIQEDET